MSQTSFKTPWWTDYVFPKLKLQAVVVSWCGAGNYLSNVFSTTSVVKPHTDPTWLTSVNLLSPVTYWRKPFLFVRLSLDLFSEAPVVCSGSAVLCCWRHASMLYFVPWLYSLARFSFPQPTTLFWCPRIVFCLRLCLWHWAQCQGYGKYLWNKYVQLNKLTKYFGIVIQTMLFLYTKLSLANFEK